MIYYLIASYAGWNSATNEAYYSHTINCATILSTHYNSDGQLVVRFRTPSQSVFVAQELVFSKNHNTSKTGNYTLNHYKIDEWVSTLNITKINIPHLSNEYPEVLI
jgi:hypothetical protein